jgi:hypothetical protein
MICGSPVSRSHESLEKADDGFGPGFQSIECASVVLAAVEAIAVPNRRTNRFPIEIVAAVGASSSAAWGGTNANSAVFRGRIPCRPVNQKKKLNARNIP